MMENGKPTDSRATQIVVQTNPVPGVTPQATPESAVGAKVIAEQLNVAVSSVYRMARLGLIPGLVVGPRGGGIRFFPSEVRKALAALAQARQEGAR